MVGTTNAQHNNFIVSTDPHTKFLMIDSLQDHSMYKVNIRENVADSHTFGKSATSRDNRACVQFRGNGGIQLVNKTLTLSDHDWTIEHWEYPTENRESAIYWQQTNTSYPYGLLYAYNQSGINFYLSSNTSSWNLKGGTAVAPDALNAWRHRALVHSGTNFLFFVNGTLYKSFSISGSYTYAGNPWIGYYNNNYWKGYIQDYRISDIARYTTDFTPPARLFD